MVRGDEEDGSIRAAKPAALAVAEKKQAETFLATLFSAGSQETLRSRDGDALAAAAAHAYRCYLRTALPFLEVFHVPSSDPLGAPRRFLISINRDRPFLVDSTLAACNEAGVAVRLLLHPVFVAQRENKSKGTDTGTGRLRALQAHQEAKSSARRSPSQNPKAAQDQAQAESLLLVELSPEALGKMATLRRRVHEATDDLIRATDDWQEMRQAAGAVAQALDQAGETQAAAYLRWLMDDHFTFLGTLIGTGRSSKALGVFTKPGNRPKEAHEPSGVVEVWKARTRSRVHLSAPMDLITVRLPQGKPRSSHGAESGQGESFALFAGLFTSSVSFLNLSEIPLLDAKFREVQARSGVSPDSHSGKALRHILNTWPRDELFHLPAKQISEVGLEMARQQEEPRLRVFLHYDRTERLWYATLCLPARDFSESRLQGIRSLLATELDAELLSHRILHDETALVRIHLLYAAQTGKGATTKTAAKTTTKTPAKKIAIAPLEQRLVALLRDWNARLADLLSERHGESRAMELQRRWVRRIPPEYGRSYAPELAAAELAWLDQAATRNQPRARVLWLIPPEESAAGAAQGERAVSRENYHRRASDAPAGRLSFRFAVPGAQVSLSDSLPILERMGFRVHDERAFRMATASGFAIWLYDFSLLLPAGTTLDGKRTRELARCFIAVRAGLALDDRFNALILAADLTVEEVAVLRLYASHLVQARFPAGRTAIANSLAAAPKFAQKLIELFEVLLAPHPDLHRPNVKKLKSSEARTQVAQSLCSEMEALLESVRDAEQDRILRALMHTVAATLRTNYWQVGADSEVGKTIAIKLAPAEIPHLPQPRPFREIFVSAPTLEAVHLRFGEIARGGLRWSDRREDFRDEILGLAKSQAIKNAVIVPDGAKGGFVLRNPPTEREAFLTAGIAAYRAFITALLEVTDNRGPTGVIPPKQVVRRDGNDPYLVVAADKGTANFSDIANEIAVARDFWLKDAFASGGSAGYNHKTMGITARGAWESVRRHFRELGLNPERDALRVIGVGDLSGDVFGNGMLLSKTMVLIAAFNHRCIFIDPAPHPARQFAERKRLFKAGADWDKWDKKVLSEGGLVALRSAKEIRLSAKAAAAIGLEAGAYPPNHILRAILCAESDLLWFGGIGTYVSATGEAASRIADHANDAIRISGREVRARVIGEGANLGITQAGRVEYARRGGRINTDFIDNSAGVDCSDHEVNIKILLGGVAQQGQLTRPARDKLLASMEDEVAAKVLRHNFLQAQGLGVTDSLGAALSDRLRHVIRYLERHHGLDRRLAGLPDGETFQERARRGEGLMRPELSVLLSHTKNAVYKELIDSDLAQDPWLEDELLSYFPAPLRKKYRAEILDHPLRREIITMVLANGVCNRAGVTFVWELAERTGASTEQIVRAWLATMALFRLDALWQAVEAHSLTLQEGDSLAGSDAALIEIARFSELVTAWLLANELQNPSAKSPSAKGAGRGAGKESLEELLHRYQAPVQALEGKLAMTLGKPEQEALALRQAQFLELGLDEKLARAIALLPHLSSACGIAKIATSCKADVVPLAALYFAVGAHFGHNWLRQVTRSIPRTTLWDKLVLQSVIDDTVAAQARLTEQVCLHKAPKGKTNLRKAEVQERIDAWSAAHKERAAAAQEVLSEIQGEANPSLSMVSLAARALRAISDATR